MLSFLRFSLQFLQQRRLSIMASSIRSFVVLVLSAVFVLSVAVHGELSASFTFVEFVFYVKLN